MAAHGRPGGVEMRVTDTGRGIPQEALTLIFEPFRQLEGIQPRRYGGTGLGLHIVKRLLELLGGAIEVDSVVGQGSNLLRVGAGEPASRSSGALTLFCIPDWPPAFSGTSLLRVL